jgi:hypothetical protein
MTCPIHEAEAMPCATCHLVHAAIRAELPKTVTGHVRRLISAAATRRRRANPDRAYVALSTAKGLTAHTQTLVAEVASITGYTTNWVQRLLRRGWTVDQIMAGDHVADHEQQNPLAALGGQRVG